MSIRRKRGEWGLSIQERREKSRSGQTRTERSSACPMGEEGAFLRAEVRAVDAFDRTVEDLERSQETTEADAGARRANVRTVGCRRAEASSRRAPRATTAKTVQSVWPSLLLGVAMLVLLGSRY